MSKNLSTNIEQIKKDKDGLDVLSDIYIYAVLGEKPNDADLIRFKWYGIHEQEDTKNYFKLKIPLTLGQLNLEQIKTLYFISKEYANNSLDFTKSQKIEFKWLKIHNIPHIFNLLNSVNLNTIFESGHNVRNVITCPVNGIEQSQLVDISEIANKLNTAFIGNKNFSNLPNKLTIAISGYTEGCYLEYIPQISFNAIKTNKDKILFSIKIIGKHIAYITSSQIVNTAKTIATLFKDFGEREDIKNSSFESLIKTWGFSKFYDILNASMNFKLKDIPLKNEFTQAREPRIGINKSKIEGRSYIACNVKSLKIGASNLDKLLNLLEKYKASKIKITHKGNIIILDALSSNVDKFAKELQKIGFNAFA